MADVIGRLNGDEQARARQHEAAAPGSARGFPLGRMLATPGALGALLMVGSSGLEYVRRHAAADWGEVDEEDWKSNDQALVVGERVLSAYTLPTGVKLWIITEWDRSVTTLLLPSEY